MEPQNGPSRVYRAKKNETSINCYTQNKNTEEINFEYDSKNENWRKTL